MGFLSSVSVEQVLMVLVVLCLALVVIMLIALLMLHKRSGKAEKQSKELSAAVADRLLAADERAKANDEMARQEISDAMQAVNETVARMMGDMTRTQQGQMDALSGQLRAAGHQEEERMERMRQTVERRLSSYEEQLDGVNHTLNTKLSGREEQMENMQRTLEDGLKKIGEENREHLEQMRQTVDEKLNTAVDMRLEVSFSAVTRRLEQVTDSLNAIQTLAGSVDELGRIVGGTRPLGAIGEVQLGTMLAQMLAPQQYAQHACVRPGGECVADYVVVMPGQSDGGTVYLPIDCSLPMREYQELCAAMDSGTREEVDSARGLLESAVRMHARRMSEKLIAPPYTTDYAVLFLPSEGLFAEILHISGLTERIRNESRMVLAGPTTFAALLTSLQMGFKSLAIEQRTQEVVQLLGAVRTDFSKFASVLDRTQKKLRQATEEIESAQKHTQTIARHLSDVSELPQNQAGSLMERDSFFDDDGDNWD